MPYYVSIWQWLLEQLSSRVRLFCIPFATAVFAQVPTAVAMMLRVADAVERVLEQRSPKANAANEHAGNCQTKPWWCALCTLHQHKVKIGSDTSYNTKSAYVSSITFLK